MPGRRHFARELAAHDAAGRLASCYAQLRAHVPDLDHALVGRAAVLDFLHSVLLLRRPNGSRLNWRIVLRWRSDHDFPLLRGGWNSWSRCLSPCLTSQHAVSAWTLAQFDTAKRRALFAVATPNALVAIGKARRETRSEVIARRYRERRARDARDTASHAA